MEEKLETVKKAQCMLEQYLESRKMRKTPERREILRIICKTNDIFSIDDLSQQMEKVGQFQVSRSTIFNTLEMLVNAGLVIKHTLQRAALYECNLRPTPKVCVICQHCQSIKKVEDSSLTRYLSELKIKQFTVTQPVLYLHGLCRKCAAAEKRRLNKIAKKTI